MRSAVERLLPVLLPEGAAVADAASSDAALGEQLQSLHHASFMMLLDAVAQVIVACIFRQQRCTSCHGSVTSPFWCCRVPSCRLASFLPLISN